MSKKLIIGTIIAVIAIVGIAIAATGGGGADETQREQATTQENANTESDVSPDDRGPFTFSCPSGDELAINYSGEGNGQARLRLPDNQYNLTVARSASGAKYTSEDGSVVFWEHQGEAMVEIDGETVYENCESNQETDQPSIETQALQDTKWQWKQTNQADGETVTPDSPEQFVINFGIEGEMNRFSASTDCNNLMGNYEVQDGDLSLSKMASTLMACPEGAQAGDFKQALAKTTGFETTIDGELKLMLEGGGAMLFSPTE